MNTLASLWQHMGLGLAAAAMFPLWCIAAVAWVYAYTRRRR